MATNFACFEAKISFEDISQLKDMAKSGESLA